MQASALTFYTLLSVVPVITMVLAVARGFGLEAVLERHIGASISGQTALVDRLFTYAGSLLKTSANGVVTGVGIAVLLWSVTSALTNIEYAFNVIWEVPTPRRLIRRIADYVATIVVGAVLWTISIGIAIAVTRQLGFVVRQLGIPGLSSVAIVLLQIGRFALIWLLFTAGYVMMPNTHVRVRSALFGGVVGAATYILVEWIYLTFLIGVAGHGAVYGGFAALPLFLTWVQITWMIVLFGAELACSTDNAETYGYAPDYAKLSDHTRRLLRLQIVHLLSRAFEGSESALNAREIARRIEVPIRLLRRLLGELTAAGLISRTMGADGQRVGYQPARSSEQLTIASILDTVERFSPAPDSEPSLTGALPDALARFQAAVARVPENARLSDIKLDESPGT